MPVEYNPAVPPETFDVVIVDECHRSIYGLWRQVLDYFDAFTIGLTATPNKQAFGFFNQNLVMEYGHEQAVADEVNVAFDVYRIRTEITEQGSTIDAGHRHPVPRPPDAQDALGEARRGPRLRRQASSTAPSSPRDQIRTVLETFRDRLFTEIFPGRSEVPKTLIFAKDDAHADEIVQIAREVFGKGNDFAAKITYKATGKKADELIAAFRNAYNPRIAVTVDMIATGTDVKPLECVFFMRSVKSRTYFEQMKGRGVRVIDDADFQAVTPDAQAKERFVIVDAVGVTESELVDTVPLDRKPTVPLETLLKQVSFGVRDPDATSPRSPHASPASTGRLGQRRARRARAARRRHDPQGDRRRASSPRSTPTGSSPPPARRPAATSPTSTTSPPPRTTLLDEAVAPLATNPELRRADRRGAPHARAGDRRDLHRRGASRPATRPTPPTARARHVESWEQFCEEQPRRDHRAPDPLRPPPAAAAHLPRGEGARPGDRPAAAPVDAREALAGLRAARPLEGARLRRARPHRPRLPRPRRPPPGRRARRLPRPRPRALPRLAPPAGERRPRRSPPSSSPGSSASATTSPPRSPSPPTTSATRRSSKPAGSARRRRCSATTSAPLLDELNEVLAA